MKISSNLPGFNFDHIHIVKKEKKLGSPDLFRRYAKCNTPPFLPNDAISAFFGVTETVEILQSLINFFGKDLNTNAYLVRKYGFLANRKPLMCIALNQTCLFHLLKYVFFGHMRGK